LKKFHHKKKNDFNKKGQLFGYPFFDTGLINKFISGRSFSLPTGK